MTTTIDLIDVLHRNGPTSAKALGAALGVSQPTISRALGTAAGQVARIGRASRTRYAALREVRGLGTSWPIYQIDQQGQPVAFGQLTALSRSGTLVSSTTPRAWLRDDFVDGLFPGIPWFLDDQRPQGFLGRQFAQRWSRELNLPADILRWNDDAVLSALLLHGEDGPGDFILGEAALERALQAAPPTMALSQRINRYADLAAAVLAGEAVGSSAAGEQPKFTACVQDDDGTIRHVIVKFSEPVGSSAASRRWADLLACEHIASELLIEHGHASATTDLVWSNNRLCLEVTRYDRIGAHGRRGCVTLAAWSDAHDGERDEWVGAASRMQQRGWIDADALEQVRQRWWFGRLIANTDMHFGNLSFFLGRGLPLPLTPSYDMLPMLYRPGGSGAVVPREFLPAVPVPGAMHAWQTAAAWANDYWLRVAVHDAVSDDFQRIAAANAALIARARDRFAA